MEIVSFPISRAERRRTNNLAQRKVPCQVSQRWFQMDDVTRRIGDTDYSHMDVMTLDSNEQPRKLCEMIIDRKDLEAVLAKTPVVED